MEGLYRVFRFSGYEVLDVKIWRDKRRVDVYLKRAKGPRHCHCCGSLLGAERGVHGMHVEGLPMGILRTHFHFMRTKANCPTCKKARSERVDFLAAETPHLTKCFSEWLGLLTEIAPVSRSAELVGLEPQTLWRIDFARMRRMLETYKIPLPRRISVDEVYARRKCRYSGEGRNERFFTVITDLETRKVIWVSESRSQKGLDQFFLLIGSEACKKIELACMDQHEDYAASVRQHCPNAVIVWDRFHLAQNFEEAVNDMRKELHGEQAGGSEMKRLSRGKFRFLFVKKAKHRTEEERLHIDDVLKANEQFMKLEIIKEAFLSFFDLQTEVEAKSRFEELGNWIFQAGFQPLMRWYNNLEKGWDTLKNYFRYKATSSLSEGINNVIKTIKRRAYGYRNMEYFRLKIMQVCGYLNSRLTPPGVPTENQLDALF